MVFCMFLLGEGWMAPALAMIQVTIDVRYKGVAMAVFLFATAISGSIGSFLVGDLLNRDKDISQEDIGFILALNTSIPCLAAAVFFFLVQFPYMRMMESTQQEVGVAVEKASTYTFEGRAISMQSYGQFRMGGDGKTFLFEGRKDMSVVRDRKQA
jgi:hypothetical protein